MADEWFYSSLTRYEQLFMFDVETATEHLEWADGNAGLWTAGTMIDRGTELTLMKLPEKLNQQDVAARRDFKILCGGMFPFKAAAIKELSHLKYLAVADAMEPVVHICYSDEKNTVKRNTIMVEGGKIGSTINGLVAIDWNKTTSSKLLVAKYDTVHYVDMETEKTTWQLQVKGVVHGLKYSNDPPLLLLCHGAEGMVTLLDHRISQSICVDTSAVSGCTRHCLAVSPLSNDVATLSYTGLMNIYDTRSLTTPTTSITMAPCYNATCNLSMQFSKKDHHSISLSGVGGTVDVYNISGWDSNMMEAPSPVFTHDGHKVNGGSRVRVLAHTWHPVYSCMMLSSADDNSLHAWQYNSTKCEMT